LCIARHAHATPQFIYIVEGAHWSGHGRGGDACMPGTLRFLPAGEPHENYFPSSSRCLAAEVRGPLLELAAMEGAVLTASGELASPSARRYGATLQRELRRNDDLSRLAAEGLLLELLLSGVRTKPSRRSAAPAWLLRVRDMLHDEGGHRLRLTDLGRCADRHPVQISRQFRQHFGCTIGEYVRRVRIARAQILVTGTDRALADIALASGFADQSHFTKAFRRLTGVPPNRYRLER
jgi:transcriptional regulator GlxA family with amidase domain